MKRLSILLPVVLLCVCSLHSQNTDYEYLLNRNQPDKVTSGAKLYCGLTHQHQNFFKTPFSLTGIEAGIILEHQILLGAYGSSFLSNLEVENSNSKTYFSSAQCGLIFGAMCHSNKWFHPGMLLNIGYFSVRSSSSGFQIFDSQNPTAKVNGLVLLPQAFLELNVLKWMKFRTGLGYSFYHYKDQTVVSKSDLQNGSLNFGFLFGRLQ